MAKKRKKMAGPQKVLVSGADGSLYVVTKNKAPVKVPKKQAAALKLILKKAEGALSISAKDIPTLTSGINLVLPEIFP
jgi:hypothetical protein